MLLFNLWEQGVETVVAFIIVIILAFAYHEFAHALVADYLGDPTPRSHGRITLNPFPHISLQGLVMLLLIGFGGAFTPVRPHLLRGNMRRSHALVAIAGPAANILMAVIFAALFRLLGPAGLLENEYIFQFVAWGVYLNLFLAFFNMLPIPPLDGFTILQGVVPPEMARQLDPLRQYGMIGILLLFFLLPRMNIDILGPMFNAISTVQNLLLYG